jgi:CRISPR-associated endonuclease/helicase Cas3
MAQTRLGEESVMAIYLRNEDGFRSEVTPDFAQSKQWFLRAMSLARKGVVRKLKSLGVPEGWKTSTLLRNCHPLALNTQGNWLEDLSVRLDDDLGLVYEPNEQLQPDR